MNLRRPFVRRFMTVIDEDPCHYQGPSTGLLFPLQFMVEKFPSPPATCQMRFAFSKGCGSYGMSRPGAPPLPFCGCVQADDIAVAVDLVESEGNADPSLLEEAAASLLWLQKNVSQFELSKLLSGPYDKLGARVTISAGAGGTDAQVHPVRPVSASDFCLLESHHPEPSEILPHGSQRLVEQVQLKAPVQGNVRRCAVHSTSFPSIYSLSASAVFERNSFKVSVALSGLGGDAFEDVPAMGREPPIQMVDHGAVRWRGGGDQICDARDRRQICVRVPGCREGDSQARSAVAIQCQGVETGWWPCWVDGREEVVLECTVSFHYHACFSWLLSVEGSRFFWKRLLEGCKSRKGLVQQRA